MALQVLHLADFHLDSPLTYLSHPLARQKREEEYGACLEWIGGKAGEWNIDLVLLCGDQFDNPHPSSKTIHLFQKFLHSLHDQGMEIAMISGNHDMKGLPGSVYETQDFSPAHFLSSHQIDKPLVLQIGKEKVFLYGFSYLPGKSNPQNFDTFVCQKESGIHIALLHGSIQGKEEWDIQVHYVPLRSQFLSRSGMDYIALGHYHKMAIHDLGKTTCAYPGSLVGKGFGKAEKGKRYLLKITLEEGKKAAVQPIPLEYPGCRIVEEETLSLSGLEMESPKALVHWIREKYGHPERILKILLEGISPFSSLDPQDLEKALERDFLEIRVDSNLKFISLEEIQKLSLEKSIRGNCLRRLLEKAEEKGEKKKIYELALQYLLRVLE